MEHQIARAFLVPRGDDRAAALRLGRILAAIVPDEAEAHGLVALMGPSVRGELLLRLDRREEARLELERAASMTKNARERDLLLARARASSSRST